MVLGLFDLKWLILVQIPLYILTEMLVYLQDHDSYCKLLWLTGSSYWGWFWNAAVTPRQKILGLSLEMDHFGANSVVYFNRNVRLFTARINTQLLYIAGGWRE